MASNSKGKKAVDSRPTLEEVKAQTGRNLFVTYEGTEGGGWGIAALRPRFVGDIPEELQVTPWVPKMIAEEWLDDVRFRDLYGRVKGIKVWKTDEFPRKPDLTLPDDLERNVGEDRRRMAHLIATSAYDDAMKDMISIKQRDLSESDALRWENEQLYPFLECVLFYEQRLLNRPEVVKDIEKRLKEIDAAVEKRSKRNRWK